MTQGENFPGPEPQLPGPSHFMLGPASPVLSFEDWWLMRWLLAGQRSWSHAAIMAPHTRIHCFICFSPPHLPVFGTKNFSDFTWPTQLSNWLQTQKWMKSVKGWVTAQQCHLHSPPSPCFPAPDWDVLLRKEPFATSPRAMCKDEHFRGGSHSLGWVVWWCLNTF